MNTYRLQASGFRNTRGEALSDTTGSIPQRGQHHAIIF